MTTVIEGDRIRATSILRRLGLNANSAATGWVAEVIAGARSEGADAGRQPFEDLFSGHPDTPCRTTWRKEPGLVGSPPESIECVEVPMDDLRAAFDEAERIAEGQA